LAGWGQFLEATSQVFQIGPYGTAAGIVVNQIAYPDAQVDSRVKAQLRKFWEAKPAGKLFPQNVRLAFTVLALAKAKDSELVSLRDEIAAVIRDRQLSDGSWNDAPIHAASPAGGQTDATAWTVLALQRSGGNDAALHRGAAWLAARIEGSGRAPLLSTIGLAAAIAGHVDCHSIPGLRATGFDVLADAVVNREELISFFDYDELQNDVPVQTRDYLCFPAFYPLAVLAAALGKGAGPWESLRLDAFRSEVVQKVSELSGGHPYKNNPTTRFTSTVDQAMYALTFEQLAASETDGARAGLFVPLYKWSRRSILVHLVLPVLLLLGLALILATPVRVAETLVWVFGTRAIPLVTLATNHEPTLQVFAGLAATLLFGTPRKGRDLLKGQLMGRGRRR